METTGRGRIHSIAPHSSEGVWGRCGATWLCDELPSQPSPSMDRDAIFLNSDEESEITAATSFLTKYLGRRKAWPLDSSIQ